MGEDDLRRRGGGGGGGANEINIGFFQQFHENFRSKTPRCRKCNHSSYMKNDDLKYPEGLKGLKAKYNILGQSHASFIHDTL